ncbi:MAG: hypothetical protein V1745_02580 [Patescibacteria group bacterium]
MIVICSGPDTFRARERMRGLVEAFRTKHDAEGFSMETIDGSKGISPILARLGSASLFARKKFVRADGCLAKMKIADVRILGAKLKTDGDATILCTIEADPPDAKTLEALKDAPYHHYPFPTLVGSVFREWVRERAAGAGIQKNVADSIAEANAGDSWAAINEIVKVSAVSTGVMSKSVHPPLSAYSVADTYLQDDPAWRTTVFKEILEAPFHLFATQARSYARVADGATEGLNAFVVHKLRSMDASKSQSKLKKLLSAQTLNRSGYATGGEWLELL